METYTYSVSNSASSPSSSFSNSSNYSATQFPSREDRNRKPPPAYRSALHSVRKLPAKHVITKKPIAPMPPTRPKIYKVAPVNFRDVVQRLTAAPEFQRTRLREGAPPPLSLLSQAPFVHPSTFDGSSVAGFNLSSPSGLAWCSSIRLSSGTVSSFDKSAVL